MTKQFWAVIAAIVVIFAGLVAFSGNKSDGSKTGKSGATLTSHIKGSDSASVTLVEYGDYQCPYCQAYEPTVEQAYAEFKDQIKFQFRNFPLTNAHPNAFAAARAAEAAALQDKFWEMHDLLYQTQNYQVWTQATDPNTYFNAYAQQLGLNVDKFKTDFASSKVNDLINADMAEGTRLNVTGTPSFFINGKKTEIANTLQSFEKVLKDAIAKQKPAATTPTTNQ
jgi:protein-disulfide isomerase